MSVWERVKAFLKAGKDPVIRLNYSMLKRPEPKKRGRPRKEREERTLVEKAALPLLGDKARPRCLNPKCRVRLKASQRHVCSDLCREHAIMAFQSVVDLLKDQELPVDEVPDVEDSEVATRRLRDPGATVEGSVGSRRSRKSA